LSREHRILPLAARRTGTAAGGGTDPDARHPLHRAEILAVFLFIGLFAVFAILVLASWLHLSVLTGHASEGETITHVNVTGARVFVCNTTIPAGTSLESFPCIPLELPRADLFAALVSGGASVLSMYRYTPWTDGRWSVYNASLPNYTIQSLTTVSPTDGIYFILSSEDTMVYNGFLSSMLNIPLRKGWNLVGYPYNETTGLAAGLASVNATYLEVKTLEGTEESGSYLADTPPPGGETLQNFSLYHGYWFRMSSAGMWVIT